MYTAFHNTKIFVIFYLGSRNVSLLNSVRGFFAVKLICSNVQYKEIMLKKS